jgi:hypothetical protein
MAAPRTSSVNPNTIRTSLVAVSKENIIQTKAPVRLPACCHNWRTWTEGQHFPGTTS